MRNGFLANTAHQAFSFALFSRDKTRPNVSALAQLKNPIPKGHTWFCGLFFILIIIFLLYILVTFFFDSGVANIKTHPIQCF